MNLTQSQRLLAYLKNHPDGILNINMQRDFGVLRYSARINDLRNDGHDIRCQKVLTGGKYKGICRYYLEPEEVKSKNVLHRIFKKKVRTA